MLVPHDSHAMTKVKFFRSSIESNCENEQNIIAPLTVAEDYPVANIASRSQETDICGSSLPYVHGYAVPGGH